MRRSRSRSRSRSSQSRSRSSRSRSRSRSMSRVDEIMREVEKSARKAKIEETIALLGESVLAIEETIADRPNPDSRAAIERKFAELNRQTLELVYHKRNIKKLTDKLGGEIRRLQAYMFEFQRADILPTALVYFVHLLEKANHFFEYKTRVTLAYNFEKEGFPCLEEICQTLFQDMGLNYIEVANKHDAAHAHIYEAAEVIYWELVCKRNKQPIRQDKPVLFNWIYRLVSRARQGDYVMDQDPEVELKKMMKNEPCVYDRYFFSKQLPVEYNKLSKLEAYEKYSELVRIINMRNKEALEEKQKSTSTTTARETGAIIKAPQKRKRDDPSQEGLC